jgi:hypothetical protein
MRVGQAAESVHVQRQQAQYPGTFGNKTPETCA